MARPTVKLDDIERAAIKLFASRGIGHVTIKDIAREAQCAEGALYCHYTGKDDLASTLFIREVSKFGSRLKTVLCGPGSFDDRVRRGVGTFYAYFDDDPVAFSFVLLSQHNFPDGVDVDPEVNPVSLLIRFVEEGTKAGAFVTADPLFKASMVLGLVLQPATMMATGRLDGSMEQRADEVTKACLGVLHS
ncbi:MAG: TetR/AcrR family transcriptional regulator [Candidatus Dadabacteria bacterium]|nr:TetR/AcrR family transcriptional regulator [Candidatus Dadabacteria bacterium]